MNPKNKTALIVGSDQSRQSNHLHTASISQQVAARKVPKKWQRVLSALIDGPKNSRQLEREAYDHVPHSTISDLRKRGLCIDTAMISVPGFAGEPARIARYSLAPHSLGRARALLGLQ